MEIQPDWQIVWRGKTYEITGLDPDYQKKDLTKIQAREVS
nr:head-tail adaptor protein [Ligilactobacillus equi]